MADGDSGNYDFVTPEVNASSNTWGTKNNDNWDAIDGFLSDFASRYIAGLTLSTAGGSASFGVATGVAGDSGGRLMKLASALTKTTSSWAVGNNQGALDTVSIAANTWYHAFLIRRPDTGVVDVLVSLDPASPTMPSGYTQKRRIGSMRTNGSSQWTKFTQRGNEFLWSSPVLDINGDSPADTNAALRPLSIPAGIQVDALLDIELAYLSGAPSFLYISSPDQDDVAASSSGFTIRASSNVDALIVPKQVRSNTSRQIRVRASTTTCLFYIQTNGWIDTRGRDD